MKTLFLALLLLVSTTSFAAGKLYTLIVTDTHASKIGELTKANDTNLMNMFEAAYGKGEDLKKKVVISRLKDRDATPAKIFAWIKALRHEKKKDSILIHISTHGSSVDGKFHKLDMKYGTLYRSDLLMALKQQDAKAAFLLTDACGSEDTLPPLVHMVYKKPESIPSETLDQLFFAKTGLVDLNAAKLGTFAWYSNGENIGGHFTFLFTNAAKMEAKALDTDKDGAVSWTEYIAFLNETIAKAVKDEKHRQEAQIFNEGDTWPKKQEYAFVRFRNLTSKELQIFTTREIYSRRLDGWTFATNENLTFVVDANKDVDLKVNREITGARRIIVVAQDTATQRTLFNQHGDSDRAFDVANTEWGGYLSNQVETRLYEFAGR